MGWNDIQKPRPPVEGVWHEHIIGCGITDWLLTCGSFRADIRRVGDGAYYLCINRHPILNTPKLEIAKRDAETRLVERIEAVLPAYEVIKARLGKQGE